MWEDPALYAVVARLDAAGTGETEERRLVQRWLREGRRAGAHLPAEHRARLSALRTRQSALCAAFEQTVNENTDAVFFTPEELEVAIVAWAGLLRRAADATLAPRAGRACRHRARAGARRCRPLPRRPQVSRGQPHLAVRARQWRCAQRMGW